MPELIFLTGASGFLGSHIAIQLLDRGYNVRATVIPSSARGRRVAELKESYARFGDRFQVVDIPDLAVGDFTAALQGVDGLIHAAAPLAGRATLAEILSGAVDGTLNLIRQAQKVGITRIVVTSSIVTVSDLVNADPNLFTDKHWYAADKETALNGGPWDVYCAAKTLAERELWAFNDAHPELEITTSMCALVDSPFSLTGSTVNPPFLYGPFPEGFKQPTPDYFALSTNIQIYRFLKPSGPYPPCPSYTDIRDCAKAHILALNSPPTAVVGRKRLVISSPHAYDFKGVLELIAEKRPELKDRLNKEAPPTFTFDRLLVDFKRIEEVVGIKKEDFRPSDETFLDAVDSLIAVEKQWAALGHKVDIPDDFE
ncbi:hypothetical protein H0H81_012753 [Sphagnurus paluster]|uniref:NAD-dependent epimerase/dehydratase domain-containing protein n=1 Tax=Sphagnurus paluster TaxID=117069 RepID=A0A9P7G0B2_9AGAR|nr:hypothetical protein H0H81_012753 [Sphagnurus paluster]